MSVLLGRFIYALTGNHMFSVDPFLCFHITPGSNSQNTVQDMSAGHSQTDRCASSELSKTHREKSQYKLARPDLFTLIAVERIYNHLMST